MVFLLFLGLLKPSILHCIESQHSFIGLRIPSFSLPSFVALGERLMDLSAQLDAAGVPISADPSAQQPPTPTARMARPSSSYMRPSTAAGSQAGAAGTGLNGERVREMGEALAEVEEAAWSMAKQMGLSKAGVVVNLKIFIHFVPSLCAAEHEHVMHSVSFCLLPTDMPALSNPSFSFSSASASLDAAASDWQTRTQRLARYLEALRDKGLVSLFTLFPFQLQSFSCWLKSLPPHSFRQHIHRRAC